MKISGIGVVLLAGAVAMMLLGGHGPRSHMAGSPVGTQQHEAGESHQ